MSTAGTATCKGKSMNRSAETERIWHEMRERLLGYVARRVSADDAEDILQDIFVRIHTKLADLKDTQNITAWAYQIARNAITDYHRRCAATGRAMAAVAEDAEAADARGDIVREAADDFARCLQPLLNQLPEHYRRAVTMTELDGLTQKAAAGRLGLSVSGMKARVQRGRSKLRDVIDDCCSVELDRRGGLVDYQRRDGASVEGCDCQ